MSEHVPDDFPINGPATQYLLDKITERIDSLYDSDSESECYYTFGENREPLSTFINYVNLIIDGGDFEWEVSNLFSDYGGEHDPDDLNSVFHENFEFSIDKKYAADSYVSSELFMFGDYFTETIKLIYPYCSLYYKLTLYRTGEFDAISHREIKTMFDYSLKNEHNHHIAFIILEYPELYENFYLDNINNYPKLLLNCLINFKVHDKKIYQKYFNIVLNKLQIKYYKFFDIDLIKYLITYKNNINCNFDTLVNIAYINPTDLCYVLCNFYIPYNILYKINNKLKLYNNENITNKLDVYSIRNINESKSIVKYLKSLYKDKNKIIIYRLHKRSQNGCKYSSDIIRKIKQKK
jgi:hypothetical protein